MSGAQSSCCGAAVRACGGHRAHRHCLVQLGLLIGHLDRSGRWEHGRLGRKCVGEEGCGISLGRVAVSEGAGDWGRCRENASSRASAARARGRRPRRDTSNEVSSASFRHWQRCLQAVSPGSGESANRSHSAAGTFTGANTGQTRPPKHARNGATVQQRL